MKVAFASVDSSQPFLSLCVVHNSSAVGGRYHVSFTAAVVGYLVGRRACREKNNASHGGVSGVLPGHLISCCRYVVTLVI